MLPSATPATQSAAAASPATKPAQARHQSQPSAISTTPATQDEGGCHQVPRLPRKVPRRHRRPSPPKRATIASPLHKRHVCHVKRRWMSPSATPATQDDGGCHQVPRLPRKMKVDVTKCHACHAKCRGVTGDQARPSAPPELAQCHKCHACHVRRRWMSPSAMPATQDEGGCHQVPRLPRKVPRRHRRPSPPKRATRASPVP